MSIWCSRPGIGFDDWDDEPQPVGGEVRSYANGWSNHYPTTDGSVEREALIDTASIPAWCVPDHQDDEDFGDFTSRGPWLRLSMATWEHDWHAPQNVYKEVHASVVMDEAAVRSLVADLQRWLDEPKVHPVEAAS